MSVGQVVSIYIAPHAAAPMVSLGSVSAMPGRGLEGDRYFHRAGTFSERLGPDAEITLIETEALTALAREHDIVVAPSDCRRNVLTRGISLNDLVDCEFTVGAVTLRGLRLCEPCAHLEKLTQPGILAGLTHRGGLRAQILTIGKIKVGDAIEVLRGSRKKRLDSALFSPQRDFGF